MSHRMKDPLLDDDGFSDQESCSTQHDQKVSPSILMNKTFTMKNGMIVDLSMGKTGDAKKGTLLLSKLLHAN